jgi:hypothetical protein
MPHMYENKNSLALCMCPSEPHAGVVCRAPAKHHDDEQDLPWPEFDEKDLENEKWSVSPYPCDKVLRSTLVALALLLCFASHAQATDGATKVKEKIATKVSILNRCLIPALPASPTHPPPPPPHPPTPLCSVSPSTIFLSYRAVAL